MNPRTTVDSIEARLRAALDDLRPIDGTPASLAARIDALPDQIGARGLGARLRRFFAGPTAATAAVLVTAILIVAVAFRPAILPPDGGSGNGPVAAFDPTVQGPGLLFNPIPTMQVLQVAAVLLALAFAYRWRSIGGFGSWRDMARSVGLILLVTLPTALALQTPLAVSGGSGPVLGYDVSLDPPPGSGGPRVLYSTAIPGGPTLFFFEVFNQSVLPVHLDGLVSDLPSGGLGPSWIALAQPTVPNTYPDRVDQLRSFTPSVIEPNASVVIYVVGRAGTCAFGPGFQPGVSDTFGYSSRGREVRLGYSILGLSSSALLELPMELVEPSAAHCP